MSYTSDPLLPSHRPPPEPVAGDVEFVALGGGVGVGRRIRTEPGTAAAAWSAVDQHRLGPRVEGADRVAAMADLLGQWQEHVRTVAMPDDPDSAANLNWPSRDVAMNRVFLACGLAPLRSLAVRPSGPVAHTEPEPGTRVRPLTEADLDAAVALHVEQIRWDEQCGSGYLRPAAETVARQDYVEALGRSEPWTWVADVDGRVVGLITVTPPDPANWFGPLTAARSPAYVGTTVVAPDHRGGGVGAALVARAHAALHDAGADVVLLHYSLLNPLSGPFWHRHGYRPLWTWWETRPASALRG